jgi:hypothetical protein
MGPGQEKPLAPQIKANRVEAQADEALAPIDPLPNDDDPCGKERPKDELRLELFPLRRRRGRVLRCRRGRVLRF